MMSKMPINGSGQYWCFESLGAWRWYSPHRAIIFVAVLLTVVAVAGGTIGIVNASRAEQAAARLSAQYLVLQPPVRQIRASVAAFNVLAAEAFSSSTPATTLVTAAVADSNSTDRAYITLQRLLALPGNDGLAPHRAAQMSAYVAARSKLGAFLAGEPRTSTVLQHGAILPTSNPRRNAAIATASS
jgi:hypothetical protein